MISREISRLADRGSCPLDRRCCESQHRGGLPQPMRKTFSMADVTPALTFVQRIDRQENSATEEFQSVIYGLLPKRC